MGHIRQQDVPSEEPSCTAASFREKETGRSALLHRSKQRNPRPEGLETDP